MIILDFLNWALKNDTYKRWLKKAFLRDKQNYQMKTLIMMIKENYVSFSESSSQKWHLQKDDQNSTCND